MPLLHLPCAPEQLTADEVEGEGCQLLQPHDGDLTLLALALTLRVQLIEHLRCLLQLGQQFGQQYLGET